LKGMGLPRNIRWFERIAYGWMVLSWALTPFNERFWLSWHNHPGVVFFAIIFAIPFTFFWIWRIARRRSNGFRWAWAVLSFLALLGLIEAWQQRQIEPVRSAISFGNFFEATITSLLLFTGDAPRWFRKEPIIDPKAFD